MGTNYSRQSIESMTKITNEIITNTITKVQNSAEVNIRQYNRINVDLRGAHLRNCGINVVQRSNIAAQAMVNATTTVSKDIATQMETKLQETITNSLEQINKGINIPPQSNIANITTRTMTEVGARIENIIHDSIDNTVKMNVDNLQEILMDLRGITMTCRRGEGLNITQESTINIVATVIAKNIVDLVMKSSSIVDVIKDVENSVKQKNEGIDLMAGIICIVIALAMCGVSFMFISKGKAAAVNTLKSPVAIVCCVIIILVLCSSSSCYFYKKNEYNNLQ